MARDLSSAPENDKKEQMSSELENILGQEASNRPTRRATRPDRLGCNILLKT